MSVLAVTLAVACTPTAASAQDSLQSAKDLYASASYDDALTMLGRLRTPDAKPEVEQLRVFCLIALGRTADADKAIQAVVIANPLFVPDPSEISPRIQEAFTRTRRQLLPDIARDMYTTAKGALERKDRDAAIGGFETLLQLIDTTDPALRAASMNELRLLASGFLDLSRALRVRDVAPSAGATAPAGTPAPPPDLTPPVAIRQTMPAWVPVDGISRQVSYMGEVRVSISAMGRVDKVEIVRSVHPAYDRLLVMAAKSWEYQPARRNGVPTASEQLVQVQLKPRQ